MEGGLINPLALIRTGAAKGVMSIRLTKAKQFDSAKFSLHRFPDEPPSDHPAVLKDRNLLPGRSLTKAVLVTIKRATGYATTKATLMVPPAARPFGNPFHSIKPGNPVPPFTPIAQPRRKPSMPCQAR
jgi:hypothetical protein